MIKIINRKDELLVSSIDLAIHFNLPHDKILDGIKIMYRHLKRIKMMYLFEALYKKESDYYFITRSGFKYLVIFCKFFERPHLVSQVIKAFDKQNIFNK